MATVKRYTGEKLLIQVSQGGSPETFAHDCLINAERGVAYNTQSEDVYLPDCEDPSKVPVRGVDITGRSVTVTGAGTMHSPSWDFWFDWWKSGEAKTVKIKENIAALDGGGTETVSMKLTQLQRTGNFKQSVTVSLTLESDGEITRADNV